MTVEEMAGSCRAPSAEAAEEARRRWDSIAKPLHGLGLLEDALVKVCAVSGDPDCPLSPRAVAVFCADNGVVAQGVTQTGQEVTAVVAGNMTRGDTSVCRPWRGPGWCRWMWGWSKGRGCRGFWTGARGPAPPTSPRAPP